MFYVLEHLSSQNGNGQPCHQWLQYAVCGKHEILQKDLPETSVTRKNGGDTTGCKHSREKERCMSTNQYQEMRNRQQAEINAFPMFFAFNKQQFAEGMQHWASLRIPARCAAFSVAATAAKSDAAKLDEIACPTSQRAGRCHFLG